MKKYIHTIFLFGVIISFIGCSFQSDLQLVNLALKKEGKTYVFTQLNDIVTSQLISQKQSPMAMPFLKIFMDEKLYVSPLDLKELTSLLGGDYNLYEYQEPSYEGYVNTEGKQFYTLTTNTQGTETIGQQEIVYTVTLKNAAGQTKNISWSQLGMSTKQVAKENCQLKSFNIVTNPHPGETVMSSQDFVVVSVNDLTQFFSQSVTHDQENQLLFIGE